VITFYKYHGAGNDFLIADNRDGKLSLRSSDSSASDGKLSLRSSDAAADDADLKLEVADIQHLCDRHTGFGADGLMLLDGSSDHAFRMIFFNPDGSGGMMCGNGGRCIAAFAADLGIISENQPITFEAPDGIHEAVVTANTGLTRTVRLSMKDVSGISIWPEERSCFLDTGTRHLVKFVENLSDYPVAEEGRRLRQDPRFAPVGTNVNFIEPESLPDGSTVLHIRTFEKGVEAETLACGTGIVAAALAAYHQGYPCQSTEDGHQKYTIKAAIADLTVEFAANGRNEYFQAGHIRLTGPAEFVGTVFCVQAL
jgi:diaminopimelate epimerase